MKDLLFICEFHCIWCTMQWSTMKLALGKFRYFMRNLLDRWEAWNYSVPQWSQNQPNPISVDLPNFLLGTIQIFTLIQGSYGFQGKKNIRTAVTSSNRESEFKFPAVISIISLVRFHGFRLRLTGISRAKLLSNDLRFCAKYVMQALPRNLAKKLICWMLTQSPKL